MFLSVEGPSLDDFQPAPAVRRWWGSAGERARRPGYTVRAPRLNQPTDLDLANELLEIEASLVE